jgi:predicted kinase
LARRHLETGAVRLVLVGGLPGTGKSTLATGLGEALGATVLRSDELRKELAGLPADRPAPAPYGEGLYRPESTGATYAEMLARAGTALALGESVVLDASWVGERRRAEARALAAEGWADTIEIRCAVPRELAARRIRRRMARGGDPSDATPDIAAKLAAAQDPWPGAVALDTSAGPADALAKALAAIGPTDRRGRSHPASPATGVAGRGGGYGRHSHGDAPARHRQRVGSRPGSWCGSRRADQPGGISLLE